MADIASNGDKKIATQGTDHTAVALAPDVCRVPGVPAPVPFPNTVVSAKLSAGATTHTLIDGAPIWTSAGELSPSDPAHAGTGGGVSSGTYRGEAKATSYSSDVFAEGNPVVRTDDSTSQNHGNTAGMVLAGVGALAGSPVQSNALAGQADQGIAGDPVDVVTGRVFTVPVVDVRLPGPLPLSFQRSYSTLAAHRDLGLGHGWSSSFAWTLAVGDGCIEVWDGQGTMVRFEVPEPEHTVLGPDGWLLWRSARENVVFMVDARDGVRRIFTRYDGQYRLDALEDPYGNRIALEYERAALTKIVDSVGRMVHVQRTGEGRIASLGVDSEQRRIVFMRYAYDARGDLVAATDACGFIARYAYDDEHRLITDVRRNGLTIHYVYDEMGRCIESWCDDAGLGDALPDRLDPSLDRNAPSHLRDDDTIAKGVQHVKLSYHAKGFSETVDSLQRRQFFGNDRGTLDESLDVHGSTRRTYDDRGLLLERVDPAGARVAYGRNADGSVSAIESAPGRTTRIERDAMGNIAALTDPEGGTETAAYDPSTRTRMLTDATGRVVAFRFDERGRVRQMMPPSGPATSIEYDAQSNPCVITSAGISTHRFTYDDLGRRRSMTNAFGGTTEYTYSDRGDLVAVRHPDGALMRFERDGEGHLASMTMPDGGIVRFGRAGYDQLCAIRDANGAHVSLRYNREGQIASIRNERGETWAFENDAANRLVAERGFDASASRVRYDASGHIARWTAGDHDCIDFVRNEAGEVIEKRRSDGTVERFAYNRRGELIRAENPSAVIELVRDECGRVVRETQIVDGRPISIDVTLDAHGRRSGVSTSLGHVEAIELEPGAMRWITRVGDEAFEDMLDLGELTLTRRLAGGGVIVCTLDTMGRRTSAKVTTAAGRPSVDTGYRYGPSGYLTEASDRQHGGVEYGHDANGRLTRILTSAGESRFVYDATGNPLELEGEERRYGPGDRLLARNDVTYVWDARGRLVEKREGAGSRVWRYAWALDRLAAVTTPDGTSIELAYDALDRRVLKRVIDPGSPRRVRAETRFVWDDEALVHEVTVRADEPTPLERTYVFDRRGRRPIAHRDHCAGSASGEWFHYVNDPRGAPQRLVDGGGHIACDLRLSAWGKADVAPAARTSTPIRLLGQYEDVETGLHYNRYRYYDPEIGQYITRDPIGPAGGLNAYAYGRNPIDWIDPLGLSGATGGVDKMVGPYVKGVGPFALAPVEGAYTANGHYNVVTGKGVLYSEAYPEGLPFENDQQLWEVLNLDPNFVPGGNTVLAMCNTNELAVKMANQYAGAWAGTTSNLVTGADHTYELVNRDYALRAQRYGNWYVAGQDHAQAEALAEVVNDHYWQYHDPQYAIQQPKHTATYDRYRPGLRRPGDPPLRGQARNPDPRFVGPPPPPGFDPKRPFKKAHAAPPIPPKPSDGS